MTTTYYDIDKVLKSALEAGTNKTAYTLEKPKDVALPCVSYKRVSENDYMTHSGRNSDKLTWGRFQITIFADTYANLRTTVKSVETKLIGNVTDFKTCVPDSGKQEFKLDDIYYSVRDYFIWWKEDEVINS